MGGRIAASGGGLTGNNILCIVGGIVLDKTETVHELDFSNVAMSNLLEEVLDFLRLDCKESRWLVMALGRLRSGMQQKRRCWRYVLPLGRFPKYNRVDDHSPCIAAPAGNETTERISGDTVSTVGREIAVLGVYRGGRRVVSLGLVGEVGFVWWWWWWLGLSWQGRTRARAVVFGEPQSM